MVKQNKTISINNPQKANVPVIQTTQSPTINFPLDENGLNEAGHTPQQEEICLRVYEDALQKFREKGKKKENGEFRKITTSGWDTFNREIKEQGIDLPLKVRLEAKERIRTNQEKAKQRMQNAADKAAKEKATANIQKTDGKNNQKSTDETKKEIKNNSSNVNNRNKPTKKTGFKFNKRYNFGLRKTIKSKKRYNAGLFPKFTEKKPEYSHKLNILVKANNIFCTCTTFPSNRTVRVGNSGTYKMPTSKRKLKHTYLLFFNQFVLDIKKKVRITGLIVIITCPKRLRYKLLKKFPLRFKKMPLLINVLNKKIFNGCRPAKKIRKKRRIMRVFK